MNERSWLQRYEEGETWGALLDEYEARLAFFETIHHQGWVTHRPNPAKVHSLHKRDEPCELCALQPLTQPT